MLRFRAPLVYLVLTLAAVAAFFAINAAGDDLVAPVAPAATAARAQASPDALFHVLLALAAVTVCARVLTLVLTPLRQPPVIGEVLAGILLGPSLLGRVAPTAVQFLFPAAVVPLLGVISQIGIIIYMFLVGLKLDVGQLRQRTTVSVAVSHASIVAPLLLGATLALWLYPRLSSRDVPFTSFALFVGISMSITAFPVLARILTDRGIATTPLGTVALTCAAVDDVTAWCLLAVLVGTVHAAPGEALVTLGLTVAYIAVLVVAVRPAALWLRDLRDRRGELTQGMFLVICVALLLSAVTTEYIGIHALFGAFALGVVVPHDSALVRDIAGKLEDLVIVILLPAFFAFTGLRTQIGLVSGGEAALACVLIVAVATAGKFGGSAIAALAMGLGRRRSLELGILMNTRGLMELIVLNVGLDLGLVSPTLFAMLVIMALVTTLATTPILDLLRSRSPVGD
jgi:Kef-type K+ transport system membrane component KefB